MFDNIYLTQIYTLIKPGKYAIWYCNIIINALKRARTRKEALKKIKYVEGHHILPRAFKAGGEKDPNNYAYLSAREHFICHRLLARVTRGKIKHAMVQAAWLMCHKHFNDNRYIITSRVYESLKLAGPWNKGLKGMPGKPCKEETKEKLKKIHTGKQRTKTDIEAMKEGWRLRKEQGYIPHNKGKKYGPSAKAISCIFISSEGITYSFPSFRKGCLELGLPTDKISQVNTGRLSDYKGWTVKALNKNKEIL